MLRLLQLRGCRITKIWYDSYSKDLWQKRILKISEIGTTNFIVDTPELIRKFRAPNNNYFYSPPPIQDYKFVPYNQRSNFLYYSGGISSSGTYGQRRDVIDYLQYNGINISGMQYDRINFTARPTYDEYRKELASSLCGLSFTWKGDTDILPARTWEILSSGVLLLQNKSDVFEENFVAGVHYLDFSSKEELLEIIQNLKKNKSQNIFISHSTTGAFLMKISSWIIFKKIKIILFIHQFLSLSTSIQAYKRVFYSFFCDNLFFSSKQFLVNWEQIVKKNIILRLLSCKKTKFVRMGVYLPRLKYSDPRNYLRFKEYSPSLIYLSRLTEWKGFNKYLEICNSSLGLKMNCIIFATQINLIDTAKLFNSDLRSVQVLYETGVAEFRVPYGSVHIYPTDYGQLIDNPQSIGMNVLEMIAQGVPSIISTENFESWPELQQSILVRAVDWQDSAKLFEELSECLTISAESAELESKKLSSAIEISKHCITLNHFLK